MLSDDCIFKREGYVEIWDGVRRASIWLYNNGNYSVHIDDDLHDGVDTMDEFLEQIDDMLFVSLADYKLNKFEDLREEIQKIGWKQVKFE